VSVAAELTEPQPAQAWTFRRAPVRTKHLAELPIRAFLFGCAALSIVTTFGIVFVLIEETFNFFTEVSIVEFLTNTEWTPLFVDKHFGVLPLLTRLF
jgi:phosphate transport system permease protein